MSTVVMKRSLKNLGNGKSLLYFESLFANYHFARFQLFQPGFLQGLVSTKSHHIHQRLLVRVPKNAAFNQGRLVKTGKSQEDDLGIKMRLYSRAVAFAIKWYKHGLANLNMLSWRASAFEFLK